MRKFAGSIVRCHFYRHWFWPKKKCRPNKFGYRKDIEKRISPCERTVWPWFFGLSFGRNFRHFTFWIPPRKGEKRGKKRISIQGVSWPNLSTDVSFSGNDFGRKKKFGLVTSATKKILKNGFQSAKEHFELHFSPYHSAEISGILHFQSRHEKPERDKNKQISFLCVSLPDLSWDVTFTGTDFGREKKFRLNKFGYRKDIEKRISPCVRTLRPWFFGLSFGRNFRHFTFRIPPRKVEKRDK